MNFKFVDYAETEEHRMIQETARKFLADNLAPIAAEIDEKEEFAWDVFKGMAELGLLALMAPEEYNGGGHDVLGAAVVAHEIAKHCAGTCTSASGHVFCLHWIDKFATKEQKDRFLPKLVTGEWVGGMAMSEPEAGSDVASLKMTAVRDGDQYVVNGNKIFITNGSIADVIVCMVRTGGPGPKGISTLIIETDSPGFTASKPFKKLGNRASPTSELALEDCRIPLENLLGEENRGFIGSMHFLPFERGLITAQCGAQIEACLEVVTKYCSERRQFGMALNEFQMVRQMLAEMAVDLQVTKTLARNSLKKYASGAEANTDSAIAKIYGAEASVRTTNNAVQLLGGYGYTREFPVERWFRDAKLYTIGGGTSQILKLIVSRALTS
ncbi:acyl-CoA dehydrogenase family protein [Thermodesulfobacteriota bacterium]